MKTRLPLLCLMALALAISGEVCKPKRQCRSERGTCQPIADDCKGELKRGKAYCRGRKCGCCVPTMVVTTSAPDQSGCEFGETVYANGALTDDTCLRMECVDGTWNYAGENDPTCGLCSAVADPHIAPFDKHTDSDSYHLNGRNGTFTITQRGIYNNSEFGVNVTVISCKDPGYPNEHVTCIGSVTYYEPGIVINMIVSHPHLRNCSYGDQQCAIEVYLNGFIQSIDNSVEIFHGTLGQVMVFQHNDINGLFPEPICINIVSSTGLSVSLCRVTGDYAGLFVLATKSLQEDPPNKSFGLFGVCDTWTGTLRSIYTWRDGTETYGPDLGFIDSWMVPPEN